MSKFQLTLPAAEIEMLRKRVEDDFESSKAEHAARMERFKRAWNAWRNRVEPNPITKAADPNYRVPLTQYHTLSKLANDMESLLGDDAEIIAQPQGPSDEKRALKVGKAVEWMMFDRMKATRALALFNLRRVLFGRAHAYIPWDQRRGPGGRLIYDGPRWINISPDDFICPAEQVESVHEFSWIIRREQTTIDDLLAGEKAQRYQNIRKNLQRLLDEASDGSAARNDERQGDIGPAMDDAAGVDRTAPQSARGSLPVYCWYGRWRMLKKGVERADEWDAENREEMTTDLLVKYQPETQLIIGVQELAKLYPEHADPRPFVEGALVDDGEYWPLGFGEMLEKAEAESSGVHNLATAAGELAVGPYAFYSPASGINLEKIRLEPGTGYPCDDPNAIRFYQPTINLEFPMVLTQKLQADAERQTGQSDMALGRQSDRPNAPRTVGQTALLLEAGNIRGKFDLRLLRDDLQKALKHIWLLMIENLPKQAFFRITEEDAQGLFQSRQGFASLDQADRDGSYDFDIKFATSTISREAQKERDLQLYQIDVGNPLIVNNPRALYRITRQLHRSFGDEHFEKAMPEPPDMELTIPTKEEHSNMLSGEDVEVRPGDDDMAHIREHIAFIEMLTAEIQKGDGYGDPDALQRAKVHLAKQTQQLRQKRLMQALVQEVQAGIPAMMQQLGVQPSSPSPMGPNLGGNGQPQAQGPTGAGAPPTGGPAI